MVTKILNMLKVCFLITAVFITTDPQAKELLFAAENNSPPYSDVNGLGISFNVINAVFENSEYDINYVSVPYARALTMLEHNKVDGVFNVTLEVDNNSVFLFGREALFAAHSYLFYPKNNKKNYRTLQDIPDGTTVGVMIEFEYGKQFEKHKHRFKLVKVSDQQQLIRLLLRERIELAIMYEKMVFHDIKAMSLPVESIRKGFLQSTSKAYLAFNKQRGDLADVVAFFDKKLGELKESKRYSKLLELQY